MFTLKKTHQKSLMEFPCQQSSLHPSEMISFNLCTPTWPRTRDKLMESTGKPVCSTQLNPGEQVEQWLEFLEFQVQEPADLVREPSEICAEKVECSLH